MKEFSLVIFGMGLIYFGQASQENLENDHFHPKSLESRTLKYKIPDVEKNAAFWIENAQQKLKEQLQKAQNENIAKNVIIFMGDGMSLPTITAARIYSGQLNGKTGEESKLFFEDFPALGHSKPYCVNVQTADSACSSTAYLGGVKGNYETIGVTAQVDYDDCVASMDPKNQVSSIMMWAQKAKKGTGIVTTTRVTHASPAGSYAHVANRNWESDADVLRKGSDPTICPDIAKQLIRGDPGKNFKVILGGGRKKLLPNNITDDEGLNGQRLDGLNLIDEWLDLKQKASKAAKYIFDKKGLNDLDYAKVDYLLGLFESEHMQYHLDANNETEPSLAEMTTAAIKMLQKEENGFVLFVEGGKIDLGHHANMAKKALDETLEFSKAVQIATELTNSVDTLIVVTADHAHTMSISGYASRGTNILGLNTELGEDKLPYTIISYANGPSARNNSLPREKLHEDDVVKKEFRYPSIVPLRSETHGADDVAVYATGPKSHLFTGTYEQNVIPHIIAYISCIGEGLTLCNGKD